MPSFQPPRMSPGRELNEKRWMARLSCVLYVYPTLSKYIIHLLHLFSVHSIAARASNKTEGLRQNKKKQERWQGLARNGHKNGHRKWHFNYLLFIIFVCLVSSNNSLFPLLHTLYSWPGQVKKREQTENQRENQQHHHPFQGRIMNYHSSMSNIWL